jgi:outer membrane protein assembly factor BamB
MKIAVTAVAVAACGHALAPARPAPDPLWRAAELVSGDGGEHLPGEAHALVALDARRALVAIPGELVEIDLARGEPTRAGAPIDGAVAAMAKVGGRVLAVGSGANGERAWWIDPRRLSGPGVDVTGAGGGDSVRAASGVAASADGKQVVITGVRLPLALRDARDLAITRVLSPERNWTNAVFVADQYVVAYHRGELVAFDLQTGKVATAKPWLTSIGFASADGIALLHPADAIGLELVDLRDPDHPITLPSADPLRVAWSPDGRHVVVIDPDRAVLYDVPTGGAHPIAVPAARAHAVFGTDGHALVVTADGALWRVDPETGRADGPRGPSVGAIAFAAPIGGGAIAVADRWRRLDGGGVRASGGWRGTGGPVFATSPNGAHVVATSIAEGLSFVEAWDAHTGAPELSAIAHGGVVALDAGDDGAITVATPDGVVRLRAGGDAVVASARWAQPVAVAGTRAVYGRAGSFAAVELGDAARAIATFTAFDCDGLSTATLSRDGARVAIVSGPRVIVRDLAAGGAELARAALRRGVTAAALDARGAILATPDALVLWDVGAGAMAELATPSPVTAIGLAPDGERVALGFADGRAGVWTRGALRGLAKATPVRPVDEPPASCPGDPLAPGDGADGPRVERLPR